MNGESLDIIRQKKALLESAMPVIFSEGKVDCEKLKAALGEDVAQGSERYVLTWAGKSEAFKVLQSTTTATLVPVKEESVDFDSTENIFIEGENLEVLKVLQRSYYGKIKMIYIDPPYNTGNDSFIYPDRFAESKDEYLKRIGEKDEEGYLLKEGMFRKNSKDNGHYHSNWLSMMYPRLFLARNLLKDDGVIFVSIDDNEVHNLRMVMNEVFGEENFIDCIIWKKRYGGGAKEKYLVSLHEYSLMYTKNIDLLDPIFIPTAPESLEKYYKLKDEKYDKRGPYRTHPLEATKSMGDRENLIYPILGPDNINIMPKRQWLWSEERVRAAIKNNDLEFIKGKKGYTVHTKQYWKDEDGNIRQSKAFSIIEDVYTQHGTNEIIELFGDAQIFPFPKPTGFMEPLLEIGTTKDNEDIVLDFFSGSCTTAHAILKSNKKDIGNRKYILVQLPEKTEELSEAYKAGLKTIADIGKERIRRVINNLKNEKSKKLDIDNKLDIGFKVFKLQPSNFKIWHTQTGTAEELARQIDAFIDPTKPDADEEDMLYELLIKTGQDLNSRIEKLACDGAEYYSVNNGALVVALAKISEAVITEIISKKPQKVIALDKLFAGNDQLKTNTALQMKDAGIEFKTI